jgi:Cell wall-associated hydrolases (invasion-associated proteins)
MLPKTDMLLWKVPWTSRSMRWNKDIQIMTSISTTLLRLVIIHTILSRILPQNMETGRTQMLKMSCNLFLKHNIIWIQKVEQKRWQKPEMFESENHWDR